MKNLLIVILLNLVAFGSFAQPLPAEVVLDLENIECQGTTISFDLSMTLEGVPLISQGSYDFSFGNMGNTETYFELRTEGFEGESGEFEVMYNDVLDQLPVSTMLFPGVTCAELVNMTVYLNRIPALNFTPLNGTSIRFSGSSPPQNEFSDILDFRFGAIPTLGQWGLIVLGMSLIIGGVVSVRRKIVSA